MGNNNKNTSKSAVANMIILSKEYIWKFFATCTCPVQAFSNVVHSSVVLWCSPIRIPTIWTHRFANSPRAAIDWVFFFHGRPHPPPTTRNGSRRSPTTVLLFLFFILYRRRCYCPFRRFVDNNIVLEI